MTTERRPVCYRCAQIKQACDGNLPCSRCTRLSLPCRARNTPETGYADDAFAADAPKARIRRVQTGCVMCKQRKKKCDEVKPKCGDCRRLCLECQWPPEKARERAVGKATGKAAVRQNRPPVTTEIMMTLPMALPTPVTATPVPLSDPFGQMSQMPIRQHSPMLDSPVSVKQEFIERNDGLQEAYAQAKSGIVNYDARATWESPMITSPPWYEMISPISNHNSPDPPDPTSLSLYVPQLLPQLTSPHDRALLNHYSHIVSPLLSRRSNTSTNPYTSYLLPLAQSNDLVLHCILGLSGNHWRKMQPNMGNRGLLHQSQATQSLARLLPHVDRTSADVALVSSLLLCMTELFDGTSEGWKLHLKGAKRLLAALRRQHGDLWTGQYQFLLRLSRFLDSAATVSTCRPPLMEEEARDAAAVEGMTPSADAEDSAVYGIPKELFHLVDQINSLADKRKNRVDGPSEALFREEAAQVEERINRWAYEYGGVSRAVMTLAPADDDALHATTAFEHALRLRLHQIVEGYDVHDPQATRGVEGILDGVQHIRYGSPLETCLLFPLVMAGGACSRMEQRVVVQDRLMVMERTCGFGYVYNARELVERVWRRRDLAEGTGEVVNWAKIRYEEMHGLVVF
ncbi:hypothetical protein ACO1O0_007593 [Amphichorda felina]